MEFSPREARLKPEFAELYPPLVADVWETAAEMGAKVLLWQVQQQGTDALSMVARKTLADFTRGRDGDLLGLVIFAGRAFLQAPLTPDVELLQTMLHRVDIGMFAEPRTDQVSSATMVLACIIAGWNSKIRTPASSSSS